MAVTFISFFDQTTVMQEYWAEQIAAGDWRAAKYLAELLKKNAFHDRYGIDGKVLLLVDGEALISFCTLVRQMKLRRTACSPGSGLCIPFRSSGAAGTAKDSSTMPAPWPGPRETG